MDYKVALVASGLILYVAFTLVLLGVFKTAKMADEQSEKYYRTISSCCSSQTLHQGAGSASAPEAAPSVSQEQSDPGIRGV